ncbi:hypothetical protein [Burkholderia cenocepacia]|uniref:hypothetical protein n=1 Tax=Burkholderia cenocepacia TaxID=95486 RepID=UPI001EF2827E|nr:hypothetical protein [Burkholderia cenocepacia]
MRIRMRGHRIEDRPVQRLRVVECAAVLAFERVVHDERNILRKLLLGRERCGGERIGREHDEICGKSVDTIIDSVPPGRCPEMTVKARSVWPIERGGRDAIGGTKKKVHRGKPWRV